MIPAIAKAYLEHGAAGVALCARKEDKLKAVCAELQSKFARPGAKVLPIKLDVREEKECQRAVEECVKTFGRVDILINGAAGNFLASSSKLSAKGFKTVMEIDTLGTFNMSRAAFNGAFQAQKHGVILNISATLHYVGTALQAHAAAAKAGVDALTRVMAVEWGPYNVRVSGIVPGPIAGTEGFERLGSLSTVNNKEASKSAFENKSTSKQGGPLP